MTQRSHTTAKKKAKASKGLDDIKLESFFPRAANSKSKYPVVQTSSAEPILNDAEKALLPEADAVLVETFNRVRALTIAAEKHVRRGVTPADVDETDGLYMDDVDYDEFVANAAMLGELVILANMSKFVGIPAASVDAAVAEHFSSLLNRKKR